MNKISFVKYNLIIAGVFFIFALIIEWTLWNPNKMSKKIPIALPICLLLMLFLIFFSQANKEKESWDNVLKGWRIIAISTLISILLIILSIWLPEKYDKDISVGAIIMIMFGMQYLMIALIGKKYKIDEYQSIAVFVDKNPDAEKWISKSSLKRLEEKNE